MMSSGKQQQQLKEHANIKTQSRIDCLFFPESVAYIQEHIRKQHWEHSRKFYNKSSAKILGGSGALRPPYSKRSKVLGKLEGLTYRGGKIRISIRDLLSDVLQKQIGKSYGAFDVCLVFFAYLLILARKSWAN